MRAQTEGARDLEWLRQVLWPDAHVVRVSSDETPPDGFRRLESFAVVPSADRPRLLVSTSAGHARAGFLQLNNAMTQRARLTKALGGVLFDLGIGRAIVRDRLHVDVRADLDTGDLSAILLERHLAELLGEDRVSLSVTFGSLRPNRKPVLQVATPTGRVIGYTKVAWNELTRALVRNEAEELRRSGLDPPRTFVVPQLLHHGEWHDREIAITSAFPGSVWRREPLNAWPPIDVLREISERGDLGRESICAAPMWADVRQRGSGLSDPSARERVMELADRFEHRFGDLDVAVGSWHGDWAPWNMSWMRDRLAIWDWERARMGVPVGLDAIHFAFQVSLRSVGRRPAEAARRTLPLAAAVLSELGVDGPRSIALLALYLFELGLRYEEATAEGVLAPDDPVRKGVLEVLSSTVGGRTG